MAGPKAPIGTLSQHATQAAQLAKNVGSQSSKARNSAAAASKRNVMKDESDSDSSESDSDNEGEDYGETLRNLQSKASGPKPKAPEQPKSTAKKEVAAAKKESSSEDSSSEESESESESESGSSDDPKDKKVTDKSRADAKLKPAPATDAKKSTPAAQNGNKGESSSEESSSEAETSSSEESESDDEEEQVSKKDTTKPAPKAQTQPSKPVAQTKKPESRPSEPPEEEEEEEESSSEEEADESMVIDQRNGNGGLSKIPEVISNEFHLRKAEDGANAAEVAKFFNEAKQQGKQIWYFTAPASIPIEVVEKLEIPLDRAQKGQSILSHSGNDYGVAFEDASTARTIKLVIPNKNGDQYRMMNGSVDQIMHLKRVTQFSQDGESLLSLSQSAHTVPPRQPRPQPPNLKARYQPFGAPSGSADDEDVVMADAPPPSSQKTPAKAKDDKKTKRKLESETPKADSGKKSKKAKVEKETPSSAAKPVKQTPIAAPPVPTFATGKKQTPVPLPTSFRRMSTSDSAKSPEPAAKPPAKSAEDKKSKAKTTKKASKPKADDSAASAKKTTPVPLPPIAGAS